MSSTKMDPSAFLKHAPQAHRVQRTGERDLSFQGWKLAESCVDRGPFVSAVERERRTCVSIFVTAGGKYVVTVLRVKRYPGTTPNPAPPIWSSVSTARAAAEFQAAQEAQARPATEEASRDTLVAESAEEMLEFLKGSNRGSFGEASREAWNQACAKYPPLAPSATETIE